jgi:hypothetical protein
MQIIEESMSEFAIDKFNKERFGLVTGSKCSVLFPDRGDGKVGQTTYAKELANQLYFQTYDEVSTWQTEHGKLCENSAFEYYHDFIADDIETGDWFRKEECGGTTDALRPDRVVDFKCPTSLTKWLDYLHLPLSKEQIHQGNMYMYLTGLPMFEIAAYLEETQFMSENGLTYPVPPNKRMIRVCIVKDLTWEERLMNALPFVIEKRDEFINNLKQHFEFE